MSNAERKEGPGGEKKCQPEPAIGHKMNIIIRGEEKKEEEKEKKEE